MKAEYQKSEVYPDNPFIEALPKRLDTEELFFKLEHRTVVKESERERPEQERLTLLSKIYQTYIPMNETAVMYGLFYQSILSSYTGKNSVCFLSGVGNNMGYATQAESFSVLGVPGAGKSSAVARILSLFPQVIEHIQYQGNVFFCKQIVYLNIQCPGDCSVKAACLSVLAEIDKAIGTGYGASAMKKGSMTLDSMIAQISQLCFTYHVGVIVVDEVQNLIRTNQQGEVSKRLVSFFVHLMNETGVGIVLVGTPQAQRLFDAEPHLARRTRGIWLPALNYGAEFDRLFYALWEQQYVHFPQPASPRIKRLYYEISGGIPALLSQALFFSQQYAILSGREVLDEELIRKTAALYHLRKPDFQRKEKDEGFQISIPQNTKLVCSVDKAATNASKEIGLEKSERRKRGRPKKLQREDDIIFVYKSAQSKEKFVRELEEKGWVEYV